MSRVRIGKTAAAAAAVAALGMAGTVVAGAAAAPDRAGAARAVRTGEYNFSHSTRNIAFIGDLRLGRKGVSGIGITTHLLQCHSPGHAPFYPGPPYNWQPQRTFPVAHTRNGVTVSFSASFSDRVSGFPERMTLKAFISTKGTISGSASLYADNNNSASGEQICQTRGAVTFTGKHA